MFCIYKLERAIGCINAVEKLDRHALLHGGNELSCLDKFSYGRFAVKAAGDAHLHGVCNFLNLPQPILIDHCLGVMKVGPRANGCDC